MSRGIFESAPFKIDSNRLLDFTQSKHVIDNDQNDSFDYNVGAAQRPKK